MIFGEKGVSELSYVVVRDNNVDQALRAWKKKLQREGFFRDIKRIRCHISASEQKKQDQAESKRRLVKLNRKREQYD
ncbi:MAG: 30S ribosomal protein S21 [Rickettsiales bacterium]